MKNFDNLAIPVGIILLIWFMSSGSSDEEEIDEYTQPGDPAFGERFIYGGGQAGLFRQEQETFSGMQTAGFYHGKAHTVTSVGSVFSRMMENAQSEGGDVTKAFLREGKSIMRDMDTALQSIEDMIRTAERSQERADADTLQAAVDDFGQEFGDMEESAKEYYRVLDERQHTLSWAEDDPNAQRVFGPNEPSYTQPEREELRAEIAATLQSIRELQQAAADMRSRARQLYPQLPAVDDLFRNHDERNLRDDGTPNAFVETGGQGQWTGAPSQVFEEPNFQTFAPSESRMSQDADSPISRLEFGNERLDSTEPPSSFQALTELKPLRSRTQSEISPMQLDFGDDAPADITARRQNDAPPTSYETPAENRRSRARLEPGSAPPEKDSPYKERIAQLQQDIDSLHTHAQDIDRKAATPVSKVYKDFDVYVREATRLQRISEDISGRVQEAPHDEETLQELRSDLKKASPPAFMKNSWYDAAINQNSAQTTVGTPIRFTKLMQDPAFRAYSRAANSIEEGLNI